MASAASSTDVDNVESSVETNMGRLDSVDTRAGTIEQDINNAKVSLGDAAMKVRVPARREQHVIAT